MTWALIKPALDWQLEDVPARKNISGGYHSPLTRQINPLCGRRKGIHSDSHFGAEAIGLLNCLQRTAWCVDQEILKVIEGCWERRLSIGNLKAVHGDPRKAESTPKYIQELAADHEDRISWRKEKHVLRESHHDQAEKARSTISVLSLARKFASEPKFYLSWDCDFRGRMHDRQ